MKGLSMVDNIPLARMSCKDPPRSMKAGGLVTNSTLAGGVVTFPTGRYGGLACTPPTGSDTRNALH